MTAFVGNTNLLELVGLAAAADGSAINDATVTVTVKDEAGDDVDGVSWPLTMAYVDESAGHYRVVLSETAELIARKNYTAIIDVNAGVDGKGHWEFEFRAATRTTE